jgi:hypothetical protein
LFHPPEQWIARWTQIQRPTTTSLYGYLYETWWRQDSKDAGTPTNPKDPAKPAAGRASP